MTTLLLSVMLLFGPQASTNTTNTTISRGTVAQVWTSSRPPDKKAGGLLIAGGIAGIVLGAIAKPPEAGPSAGFYVGVPLMAVGAYVQHHKRPATLVYARPGQASIAAHTWPGVQALRAGTPIRVVMKGGDVEGTFVAANDDELVIHLKRGDFSVDRANVKRLDRQSPESNRGRNVGLGAGLGFVAGLVRSQIGCGCSAVGGSMVTAQSMLIGTLVGATASAVNWETVYRRDK
jgi:hypothetical protein